MTKKEFLDRIEGLPDDSWIRLYDPNGSKPLQVVGALFQPDGSIPVILLEVSNGPRNKD
jgi:hypothetical protein